MAKTTKKSPTGNKAKIKTAQKSATKPAKVTKQVVAAKAQKATKKPATLVKNTSVKPTKAPMTKQLNMLLLLSGGLSLALAAAAGFLMNSSSYQLFTSLLTKDSLASKANTVFVPAIHAIYDIELRWVVVAILVLSAILPLLAATRYRKKYEASLITKVMPLRWIEMAVISGLMVEVVALINGVQDIMTLKLIGGVIVVSWLLGWLSERQNIAAARPSWGTYVVGVVIGFMPWVLIAVYAIGTYVYGMVRSPWYVYALYAAGLISFAAYALNGKRELRATQSYEVTERNYLRISILAKVAFAAILIGGLYKK